MIDGLTAHRVVREGVGLAAWSGGRGPTERPPVLLLHGYPQTSLMWRHVVPALLTERRVVLMDLRGYGASDAPLSTADDATYAKREMAADAVAVLDALGIERADVVGHDRGARVAHRLCLDRPERVSSVAVLDVVPTLHMFEHVDRRMAEAYFHWFFLTRPGGLPEALIRADVEAWMRSRFAGRHAPERPLDEGAVTTYVEAFRRPGVVEATCADYRAAAGVDLEHDRADREAGRRIEAPLLVGWGTRGYVGTSFDVAGVWAEYATTMSSVAIDADHYVAEENPAETLAALTAFWGAR
jgi:haloacetate dehalogenase